MVTIQSVIREVCETDGLAVGDATEIASILRRDYDGLAGVDGELLSYNDRRGVWSPVRPESIGKRVAEYSGTLVAGRGKLRVNPGLCKDVYQMLITQHDIEDFDARRVSGIAFRNGFLHIDAESGKSELIPHSKAHYARHAFDFDYDPNAPCDRWVEGLRTVWAGCPDVEERISCLQEYVGSCLIGQATQWCKAIFMTGTGSNGKSTVIETIESLFPEDAIAHLSPELFSRDFRVFALQDKYLNTVGEIKDSAFDTTIWKDVIDGGKVESSVKYKDDVKFPALAGHIYAQNRNPEVRDSTNGFWNRVIVLDFPNSFSRAFDGGTSKQDIVARYLGQAPGIMAWAIKGARRALGAGRLTVPSSSAQARKDWRDRADQCSMFISEICEVREDLTENYTLGASQLYPAFVLWAKTTGHRHPMTLQTFSQNLWDMKLKKKVHGVMRVRVSLPPVKMWGVSVASQDMYQAVSEGWGSGLK